MGKLDRHGDAQHERGVGKALSRAGSKIASVFSGKHAEESRPEDPHPVEHKHRRSFHLRSHDTLDDGLDILSDHLGLGDEHAHLAAARPVPVADCTTWPTESLARTIYYAPDMDGQAEPGEVVWLMIQPDGSQEPAFERPLLVVGHNRQNILALQISSNPAHQNEDQWLDIGSGAWDEESNQSWVRLDKIAEVGEDAIRRQGAVLPRRRFDRVAARMRNEHGWQ